MAEIPDYDAHRAPDWYGPPPMLGGYVTGPLLVSQSDSVVVVVRQVLAFPAGVEAEVEGHARGPRPAGAPRERPDPAEHPSLRFRVQFADGSEAVQDDEAGLRSGHGPMLTVRRSERTSGGPDGREDVRMTLWIWPLPPAGPFALACSWPDRGLDAAAVVFDANAIRAAASEAQPLWPSREP